MNNSEEMLSESHCEYQTPKIKRRKRKCPWAPVKDYTEDRKIFSIGKVTEVKIKLSLPESVKLKYLCNQKKKMLGKNIYQ